MNCITNIKFITSITNVHGCTLYLSADCMQAIMCHSGISRRNEQHWLL